MSRTSGIDSAADAGAAASSAAAGPAAERLGQAGLAAKGVLYAVIGFLALQLALGNKARSASQQGALRTVAQQPFGKVLLAVLAVGLLAYTLWRLSQVFLHHGEDSRAEAWAKRGSCLLRAVVYGSLFAATLRLLTGSGGGSGGSPSESSLTARVLQLPFGVALVVGVGLAVVGVGLYQGYKGVSKRFLEELRTARMTPGQRTWATRIGTAGLVARGAVFCLLGFFVVKAALEFEPRQATGLDGALQRLTAQPYGPWLLGVVAIGLFAYGVYCGVQARWADVDRVD